jgi:hypothetical protein
VDVTVTLAVTAKGTHDTRASPTHESDFRLPTSATPSTVPVTDVPSVKLAFIAHVTGICLFALRTTALAPRGKARPMLRLASI